MPAEVMDQWHQTGKPAQLGGVTVRPFTHPHMKGTVLSVQRGQAEVFLLIAEDGSCWVLKKFHRNRAPNWAYLAAVGSVLPCQPAFFSGRDRRLLDPRSLSQARGSYYSRALADWLDGTLLMPRVQGCDWAGLADGLRDGTVQMGQDGRLALCRELNQVVAALEACQCSHRDLSSGNVFIHMSDWTVLLIDFDSLYHPSLSMPAETTCGTEGYAAPSTWRQGQADARMSWCPRSDRYALGLLSVELLILDRSLPMTAEGGMFRQDELCRRKGPGLDLIRSRLQEAYPAAIPLLDAVLASTSFDDCPSPQDWLAICNGGLPAVLSPPGWSNKSLKQLFTRDRAAAPIWPAPRLDELETPNRASRQSAKQQILVSAWQPPSLSDLPEVNVELPAKPHPAPALPPDPWSN